MSPDFKSNANDNDSIKWINPFYALDAHIRSPQTSNGDRAALTRLHPDRLQPHEIAALARALLKAQLSPESWQADTWPRWALIAHGIALAGHDGKGQLGKQLARAEVKESRVTKLLTARGEVFRQLLPRLLRLMANKGVAPNWTELGELILLESSANREKITQAEEIRLGISRPYFLALSKK